MPAFGKEQDKSVGIVDVKHISIARQRAHIMQIALECPVCFSKGVVF